MRQLISRQYYFNFLASIICLLLTQDIFAHARFLPGGNTPGRNNNPGLKVGPCGGVPKAATPTLSFQRGQVIRLQWEETIQHPGRYEFYISSDNDQSFQHLLTVQDTQDNNVLPHRYEMDLQLPANLTCENCTLQMIQQMTENPANPTQYYSCADMRISVQGDATPTNPVDEGKNDVPAGGDCHTP